MNQKTEDVIQVLLSEDMTEGTNICSGSQKTSPEPEPPEKKRAKRGGNEEAEEGELVDSSDEEDDNAACDMHPANHTEGIEEEAADS